MVLHVILSQPPLDSTLSVKIPDKLFFCVALIWQKA